MYPYFIDMGYDPSLFWELSLAEISDLIESYARKEEKRRAERKAITKDLAMMLYNHATQCSDAIAGMMPGNGEHKRLSLATFYPDLFPEEKAAEEEKKKQDDLALHKARMDDYVFKHNEALRKRGENNGRNDS